MLWDFFSRIFHSVFNWGKVLFLIFMYHASAPRKIGSVAWITGFFLCTTTPSCVEWFNLFAFIHQKLFLKVSALWSCPDQNTDFTRRLELNSILESCKSNCFFPFSFSYTWVSQREAILSFFLIMSPFPGLKECFFISVTASEYFPQSHLHGSLQKPIIAYLGVINRKDKYR